MTTQIPATETPAAATARAAAPTIEVRLFAGAAAEYGREAETVRGTTLQEVLDALTAASSAQAAHVIGRSSFLVNAMACTDRSKVMADGDRVDVLPPFAGG